MATYSFLDVNAVITGPSGNFTLGSGSGNAEEGISIEPSDDIGSMTIGADGTVMHSLHANRSGTITVRLLKTSPRNFALQAMYDYQTTTAAAYGQNTFVLTIPAAAEVITITEVAFKRAPNLTYAKEGGTNEWVFNGGKISRILGSFDNGGISALIGSVII